MDLVQNLKKTLTNLADKILVELSCLYIKQLAKQTMKRQDNSSSTMSSQKDLTMGSQDTTIAIYYQDTSEKTTMKMETEDIVAHVREWAIDKVGDIHEEVYKNQKDIGRLDDACAIYQEFVEWIEPETTEFDIISLEKED